MSIIQASQGGALRDDPPGGDCSFSIWLWLKNGCQLHTRCCAVRRILPGARLGSLLGLTSTRFDVSRATTRRMSSPQVGVSRKATKDPLLYQCRSPEGILA